MYSYIFKEYDIYLHTIVQDLEWLQVADGSSNGGMNFSYSVGTLDSKQFCNVISNQQHGYK